MPVEGSKLAPKNFRGESAEVGPFLHRFKQLAALHNLTDGEKCKPVIDYCIAAYRQRDWGQLKANIKDLQVFTAKSRKQAILSMRDWHWYLRQFVRIASWLQEAHLLLKDLHHDMSKPFDPTDIQKAAEALLEWSENESDGDSDDFLEISVPKSRKHTRGHQSSNDESDFSEENIQRSVSQEYRHAPDHITGGETLRKAEGKRKFKDKKKFNQLVDQMQNLSLDDPKYGFLYLKVCEIKLMAAECLPKPKINNAAATVKGVIREVPLHMAPNSYDRNLQSRPQRMDNHGYYGCGDSSHIIHNCPTIEEYLRKGYIVRDNSGRIVQPDGSPL
ncbi:hypothetical protein FKP32DRAFT_1613477 [Trametes sanguinea]|nr:hypothetical protein FKP32DRAFT_1613477 [Trametes sanguinea]